MEDKWLSSITLLLLIVLSNGDAITQQNEQRVAVPVTYSVETSNLWQPKPFAKVQPRSVRLETTEVIPEEVVKHPSEYSYDKPVRSRIQRSRTDVESVPKKNTRNAHEYGYLHPENIHRNPEDASRIDSTPLQPDTINQNLQDSITYQTDIAETEEIPKHPSEYNHRQQRRRRIKTTEAPILLEALRTEEDEETVPGENIKYPHSYVHQTQQVSPIQYTPLETAVVQKDTTLEKNVNYPIEYSGREHAHDESQNKEPYYENQSDKSEFESDSQDEEKYLVHEKPDDVPPPPMKKGYIPTKKPKKGKVPDKNNGNDDDFDYDYHYDEKSKYRDIELPKQGDKNKYYSPELKRRISNAEDERPRYNHYEEDVEPDYYHDHIHSGDKKDKNKYKDYDYEEDKEKQKQDEDNLREYSRTKFERPAYSNKYVENVKENSRSDLNNKKRRVQRVRSSPYHKRTPQQNKDDQRENANYHQYNNNKRKVHNDDEYKPRESVHRNRYVRTRPRQQYDDRDKYVDGDSKVQGTTYEAVKKSGGGGGKHDGGGGGGKHGGGGGGSGKHGGGGGGGGNKDTKYEKGNGEKHGSDHFEKHGDKGDKGYKGHHEYEKGKKGHHDKEAHKGHYSDHGGHEKKHHEDGGHFGEHHKGEKGEKDAKYEEEGKHEKGHSTKGEHNIHKKDEYEKKHEFYDEYHEGGDHEKHGAFHEEHDSHKGGSKKGGHHKSTYDHDDHGKKGHSEKGHHYDDHKGHKHSGGHDEHHEHKDSFGKKDNKDSGKKWNFKKGGGGGGGKKH